MAWGFPEERITVGWASASLCTPAAQYRRLKGVKILYEDSHVGHQYGK